MEMSAALKVSFSASRSRCQKTPAPAELRLIEFRVGVVMVEHEALSRENLEEKPDQEDEVGRIAGMDHVEAVAPPHLEREHELPEERDRVFDEIGRCAPRLDRQGMAIDPDAVDHLVGALIAGAFGTDHRHLVTRSAERGRLRPGTAVERNREVLHHDQHSELTAPSKYLREVPRALARKAQGTPMISVSRRKREASPDRQRKLRGRERLTSANHRSDRMRSLCPLGGVANRRDRRIPLSSAYRDRDPA